MKNIEFSDPQVFIDSGSGPIEDQDEVWCYSFFVTSLDDGKVREVTLTEGELEQMLTDIRSEKPGYSESNGLEDK